MDQSGANGAFRGNAPARIDEKGRLKVPNAFRSLLESLHGRELFVTSLTGEYVRIYPMPVWLGIEEKLGQMPSTHPSRLRFLDRVNYFGQPGELDAVAPRRERVAGARQRVEIAVEADDARGARFEQRARMAAEPDRAVDEQPALLGAQILQDFGGHDRDVRHQIPNSDSAFASSSV